MYLQEKQEKTLCYHVPSNTAETLQKES